MGERSYLSIGDVLALLRDEFPDITISKIRFLESRGLLIPERTPSGYRKFYDHDVDRLRWILRQQRENFLPLKVIKGRLEGQEPGSEATQLFDVAPAGDPPPDAGPAGMPAEAVFALTGEEADAPDSATREHHPATARSERETCEPEPALVGQAANGSRSPVAAGAGALSVPGGTAASGSGMAAAGGSSASAGAGSSLPLPPTPARLVEGSGEIRPRPGQLPPRPVSSGLVPPRAIAGLHRPTEPPAAAPGEAPAAAGASAGILPRSEFGPVSPPPAAPVTEGSPPGPHAGAASPVMAGSKPANVAPAGGAAATSASAGAATPGTPSAPAGGAGSPTASRPGAMSGAGRAAVAATPPTSGPAPVHVPPAPGASSMTGASLTADELAHACGLEADHIAELEEFGLIEGRMVAGARCYDEEALVVAHLASGFAKFGVESRHLRIFKHAAERQASLYSQVVMPLLRQRNPEARRRAHDDLTKLTELGASLQACFAKAVLRDITRG